MQVYLSYAHADEPLARQLSDALQGAGLNVWDGTEIFPSDNAAAKAGAALENSDVLLVLLTPDAAQSGNVGSEVAFALGSLRYDHRIVPVVTVPAEEFAPQSIPWVLRGFAKVFLPPAEQNAEGFGRVVDAVQQALQTVGQAAFA